MRVIIKPIKPPIENPCEDYRIFDDVTQCYDEQYPIIKILHKSKERYVMMRVPENCYMICERD